MQLEPNRKIGDRLSAKLTDGRTIEIAYIGDDENGLHCWRFLSALEYMHMNDVWTNIGGWGKCLARRVLNSELLELLPAELRTIIVPNKTVYVTADGELHTCEDLLWLPSETELCGENYWSSGQEGERFPFFSDWRNRLVGGTNNKQSAWQWTRSVCLRYSGYFVFVDSDGSFQIDAAYRPIGVAPCFATNIEL